MLQAAKQYFRFQMDGRWSYISRLPTQENHSIGIHTDQLVKKTTRNKLTNETDNARTDTEPMARRLCCEKMFKSNERLIADMYLHYIF